MGTNVANRRRVVVSGRGDEGRSGRRFGGLGAGPPSRTTSRRCSKACGPSTGAVRAAPPASRRRRTAASSGATARSSTSAAPSGTGSADCYGRRQAFRIDRERHLVKQDAGAGRTAAYAARPHAPESAQRSLGIRPGTMSRTAPGSRPRFGSSADHPTTGTFEWTWGTTGGGVRTAPVVVSYWL